MSISYDQKDFSVQTTTASQLGDDSDTPSLKDRYTSTKPSNLFFFCSLAFACIFIPGPIQYAGISGFVGILVSVLIMDWQGFITLNGRLSWREVNAKKCWLLILIYLFWFPLFLIDRVTSNEIKSVSVQSKLPLLKARPIAGFVTGLVVMLLSFPFVFALAQSHTNTLTTQQIALRSHTAVPTPTLVPTPTPQATSTPTPQPTPVPTQPPMPTPTLAPQPAQLAGQAADQQSQQLFLEITWASAVNGSYGLVSVKTLPGAALNIKITYCGSSSATSSSLQGTEYADENGEYTWIWEPETQCRGQATANVKAELNGETVKVTYSFYIQ